MRITDHAVVRYLERFYDLNLDSIRKTIQKKAIEISGGVDGFYGFGENTNLQFVVKGGDLVTFLDEIEEKSNLTKGVNRYNNSQSKAQKKKLGHSVSNRKVRLQIQKKKEPLSDILYSGRIPESWEI